MTKNKKKLRRAERRYSVTKSAQTLVLAGMLLAGGVSGAMAAELADAGTTGSVSWDVSAATAGTAQAFNGTLTGALIVTTTGTQNFTDTLTVKGNNSNTGTLVIDSAVSFGGAVTVGGGSAAGEKGILKINDGKTFTSDAGTTVNAHGSLDLIGSTTAGAIHAGNVTLNNADALLNVELGAVAAPNEITGTLTVTDGAAKIYKDTANTSTFLKVSGGNDTTAGVTINKGTMTVGNGGTKVGSIEVTNGTLIAASGSDDAKLLLNGGTHIGDITLNGTIANTVLAAGANGGTVQGNVIVTKGTVNATDATPASLNITGNLSVAGAANGDALVNVNNGNTLTVDGTATVSNGTLTLGGNTGSSLVLGDKLVLNNTADPADAADAELVSNTGANKIYGDVEMDNATLTLTNGTLTVYAAPTTDAEDLPTDLGTLSVTNNTVLTGGSGELVVGTLKLNDRNTLVASASGLDITTNKLDLSGVTNIGAASNGAHNITIASAAAGETIADFTNQDITLLGATSNVTTLQLGTTGNTGTSTTGKQITLNGTTDKTTALLNVGYGTFEVAKVNVGTATGHGTLTVNNGGTLKTDLNLAANGMVNVTTGKLVDTDGFSIAYDKLITTASAAGNLGVASGGTFDVQGELHLSGNSANNATSLWGGTVSAQTLKVDSGVNYINNGGQLTLTGDGTVGNTVINATSVALTNGGLLTLEANENSDGTITGGGTYGGKITVTNGTLTADQGTWHVKQLDVAATTGKTEIKGNLVIDGTTSGDLKSLGAGNSTSHVGLNVSSGGTLTANKAVLFDDITKDFTRNTNINTIDLATGAQLIIAELADGSITLSQTSGIATQLKTGNGLIDYGKALKIGPDDVFTTEPGLKEAIKGNLAHNSNAVLTDRTVGYDESKSSTNPTITTGGFSAKDLLISAKTGTTKVDITLDNSLQLVGNSPDSLLVAVVGDTDKKVATNIAVGAGLGLTFGSSSTTATQGGTLKGDVTLGGTGSDLVVLNGNYTVKNITATDTTDTVDVQGGTLNAAKVNLNSGTLDITGGTLNASDTINAGEVNLKGGNVLSDKAITLGAVSFEKEGGAIVSGTKKDATGNLTMGAVTIVSGAKNIIAAGNDLTVDSFADATDPNAAPLDAVVKNATITAGNDFTITTGGIHGQGLALTVEGALKTTNSATVRANEKSEYTIKTLDQANTGNVVVEGASTLTVTTLTGTAGKTITIGTASEEGKEVKDGSTLTSTNTTLGGGTLSVLNAKASLGELTAAGGTIFVDPAYVNIDSVKGDFGASLLAGAGGQVTVGALNEAWVQKAIKDSHAATDSSVLGIQNSLKLKAGGKIVVDAKANADGTIGSTNAATSDLHFGDKSLLALDGSKFIDAAKPAAIVGAGQDLFVQNTGDNKARLYIANVKTGDTVKVLSGVTGVDVVDSTKNAAWLNNNITFDTQLFKGEGVTNDTKDIYNVTVKSVGAHNIFPQMSTSMGGLVDRVMGQYGLQTDSTNAGVRFVSRAVSDSYGLGGNNAEHAAATIEGAAQLAVVGAAPAMTLSAVQAGTSTVTTRTSFASPLMDSSKAVALHKDVDGTLSVDSGLNAGNGMKNGFGLWIMPLYQSNSAWGMKADGFKGGYKSDLGGVALGADYTFNDMFRLGLAFNIGGGYAESNGDFNKTENSFNFWGINAYGGWTMNNFGITADVGYTGNYNKLEQELPGAMGMGDIKSDVNSSAWTAGLRGEYKFATEALDIIPHVGVRYTGLTTDEYKAKSGGDTVFKVDQDFQSIWTFPIGVTLAKEIETGSGWIIRPQVDLGITPATGDVKAKSKTRIPGVDAQAEMKMQVVDYMSYDGGLGLEMKKDNVSFGINYNIQASEHRTGHGVFGTFRYEF